MSLRDNKNSVLHIDELLRSLGTEDGRIRDKIINLLEELIDKNS